MSKAISVIVPMYNEAQSFSLLLDELTTVMQSMNRDYEILFVDDCSTDDTAQLIKEASRTHPEIVGIFMRANTKKCGALREGIARSSAPVIVTLDGDLQDDPAEIPKLLQGLENGADVVIGWKKNRQDGPGKRIPSRVINYLCSRALHIELHDMNSGLKAIKREAALSAPLFDSLYRYMAHFLAAEGFIVREIPVLHRQRQFGVSKFGWLHRLQGMEDFVFVVLLVGLKHRRIFLWLFMFFLMGIGLFSISAAIGSFMSAGDTPLLQQLTLGILGLFVFSFGLRIAIVYAVYRQRVLFMDAKKASYITPQRHLVSSAEAK